MTSSGLKKYARNVEGWIEMPLVLERRLAPSVELPAGYAEEEAESNLNISVIFTTIECTVAAMKRAAILACSLGGRITLLVPQVVPYPLPLESPPVLLDWNENRFRVIANQSPVETIVRLYLCRDSVQTMIGALTPKSLVVIGAKKRRWPFTHERSLARTLRRQGHEIIFTEAG